MRKRYAGALGFLVIFCLVALAILFRKDIVHIPTAKVQRDFELSAHRELIQSFRRNGRSPDVFTTDGCSGGLSKAWRTVSDRFSDFAKAHEKAPPWESCCVVHDRTYHSAGGANEAHESYALRLSADQALRECVLDTGRERSADLSVKYGLSEDQVHAAYQAIANAVFDAVRIGGLPCSGQAWRWGYGYPHCPRTADN